MIPSAYGDLLKRVSIGWPSDAMHVCARSNAPLYVYVVADRCYLPRCLPGGYYSSFSAYFLFSSFPLLIAFKSFLATEEAFSRVYTSYKIK